MPSTFDTPLTFGASLNTDNKTANRFTFATLEDMSFEYLDDDLTFEEMVNNDKEEEIIYEEDNELFELSGPCTFNGSMSNITGSMCSLYSDSLYIDTNIKLFNSDNYQKDFDLSFDIDDYNSKNQEVVQATLMNAFLERTGKGYGILIRKNNDNLNFIIRDGNGNNKEFNIAANKVSKVRIVRKNNNVCYSINNDDLKFALDMSTMTAPFDVPVTFGASLDANKNPFRYINGTLSNMKIEVGKLDDKVVCDKG